MVDYIWLLLTLSLNCMHGVVPQTLAVDDRDVSMMDFLQQYIDFYSFSSLNILIPKDCQGTLNGFWRGLGRMPDSYISINYLEQIFVNEEMYPASLQSTVDHIWRFSASPKTLLLLSLPFDCDQMYWIAKMASVGMTSSLSWLVVGDKINSDMLNAGRLPLDNLVTFANITASQNSSKISMIELWETYTVNAGTPVAQAMVGHWYKSRGLYAPSKERSERRMNLLGAKLNCVTAAQAPGVYVDEYQGEAIVTGWIVILLNILEKNLNFTCPIAPAPDRQFGALKSDGSWSGMVGEVVAGRADIITASLDNTLTRSKAVNFLVSIESTGFIMIMKPGNQLGSVWTAYTSEFSTGVWICVVALVVTGATLMSIISRVNTEEETKVTLGEAFVNTIGIITSQGQPRVPTSVSGRLAYATLLLVALLIVTHYTSWLYSILTVYVPFYPFDSFQSLLEDGSHTVGVIEGFSIQTELKNSPDELYHRVWQELVYPDGLVKSAEEGMSKALEDEFIFLMIETEFQESSDPCAYLALPQKYFKFPSGFAVGKGSQFEDILNRALIKVMGNGVLRRIKTAADTGGVECETGGVSAMSLVQMISAFGLLAMGGILGVLMCIFENCSARNKKLQ